MVAVWPQAGKNSIGLVVVIASTSLASKRNIRMRATSLRSSSASLSSVDTTRQSVTSPGRGDRELHDHLALQFRLLAQRPAVERVDRGLVAVEDDLDLFAAARGPAAGAAAARRPVVADLVGERGHGRAGRMPLEVAGPAAESRRELAGVDAAAADAGARRHERPLRAAFALDAADHRRGAHLRRLERLAQVLELVLHREQSRVLRLLARLGLAVHRLRRRHRLGLRLGLRLRRLGLLHLGLRRRRRRRFQDRASPLRPAAPAAAAARTSG